MKYIDANIFVSGAVGDSHAKALLIKIASGELKAATSLLSWDEFVWALRKYCSSTQVNTESSKFLEFPHLMFFIIDNATVRLAHELMEKYGLHPRDALHAASALKHGITEIVSDDSHFDKVKELGRIPLNDI